MSHEACRRTLLSSYGNLFYGRLRARWEAVGLKASGDHTVTEFFLVRDGLN